jgi:hypothetical protein
MNNTHLHIIGSKPFFNLLDEMDFNYTFSLDDDSRYSHDDKFITRIIFVKNTNLKKVKRYFQEDFPTIFIFDNNSYDILMIVIIRIKVIYERQTLRIKNNLLAIHI